MALAPEVLIGSILAILFGAVLIGLSALSKLPARKGCALIGAILLLSGGLIALGVVEIPSGEVPKAQGLYAVQILSSSDTDRTETGEFIDTSGHSITFTMNDANADGLGDINLDVRVSNQNIGSVDDLWAFSAELTFVDFTQVAASGAKQPVANMTNLGTNWDISFTGTEAGAPTFQQEGSAVYSRDFATGMSDVLNIDFAMRPEAMDDLAAGGRVRLTLLVGGLVLDCYVTEGV